MVKQLRRRLLGLLLLPVLSLIFIIGWLMYFIGDKKANTSNPQRTQKKDSIKFGLIEELAEKDIDQEQQL
jgi:hypothetical protein